MRIEDRRIWDRDPEFLRNSNNKVEEIYYYRSITGLCDAKPIPTQDFFVTKIIPKNFS